MAYNHRKAEIEWLNWKEKEEKQMRELGMDEDTIQRLHTYDWQQFKAERNFYEWQSFTDEDVEEIPETAARELKNIDDLLNSIENQKVFEGCMPVEVMAKRGEQTLVFGPLKPVGLVNPKTGKDDAYAVVQLRQDNKEGTLYNLVGFQTNLKWGEQKRVFSMIPGLENAEFVRYGVMHRNTYINSPTLLNKYYQMEKYPKVFFAGQITGVEGYVESASSGILAGYNMAAMLNGKDMFEPDSKTCIGALPLYISNSANTKFQPMNANFGIIDGLNERIRNKAERYNKIANRALDIMKDKLKGENDDE